MNERRRRGAFGWRQFGLGFALTLFALVLHGFAEGNRLPALRALNEAAFDQLQLAKPRQIDPSVPVAVVDIDVESLAALGQWPWPRTELAELVRRLTELGALSIAFDVVFAEPDRTSPARVIETWRKYDPEAEALGVRTLQDHDAAFAAAIARAPVVLGVIMNNDEGGGRPPQRAGISHSGSDPRPVIPNFVSANVNLPILSVAASGVGNFSLGGERAAVIRRVPLLTRIDEQIVPTLSIEAIRAGFQAGSILVKSTDGSGEFGGDGIATMRVGPMEIPVEWDGGLYVYYSGPMTEREERVVSAAEIMAGDAVDPALAERIQGHVIFIGASAPGLLDLVATPFESAAAGVNVHAELAEQIIARYFQDDRKAYRDELAAALPAATAEERPAVEAKIAELEQAMEAFSEPTFVSRPNWTIALERAFILLVGLLVSALMAYNRVALGAGSAVVALASVAAAFWFSFDLYGFLLSPVYPALGVVLPWGSLTVYNYAKTDAEKRAVKNQFAHFMSPEVIEEIADDP
ncbi:MAG: CHASE2 domain-containing protein, partial [Pseudomonadota bacterium]